MTTARKAMEAKKCSYKRHFDQRVRPPKQEVTIKSRVYVRKDFTAKDIHQKLARKVTGPYLITVTD